MPSLERLRRSDAGPPQERPKGPTAKENETSSLCDLSHKQEMAIKKKSPFIIVRLKHCIFEQVL